MLISTTTRMRYGGERSFRDKLFERRVVSRARERERSFRGRDRGRFARERGRFAEETEVVSRGERWFRERKDVIMREVNSRVYIVNIHFNTRSSAGR